MPGDPGHIGRGVTPGVAVPCAVAIDWATVKALLLENVHPEAERHRCAHDAGGVVGEALGMSIGHSALAPSGQPIWLEVATRPAAAVHDQWVDGRTVGDVLTHEAIENAMLVHADIAAQAS